MKPKRVGEREKGKKVEVWSKKTGVIILRGIKNKNKGREEFGITIFLALYQHRHAKQTVELGSLATK